MARIDQLVQALHQHNGESLIIAAGEKLCLRVGGQSKTLTAKEATVAQVQGFLNEIAPPDLEQSLAASGSCEFTYAAPAATVRVLVAKSSGLLKMRVTLAGAEDVQADHAQTAAPPAVAAAPPTPPPAVPVAPPAATAVPTPPPATAPAATIEPTSPPAAAPTPPPAAATAPPASAPVASGAAPFIEHLFRKMIDNGCSDLHLSSDNPPLFRKDGEICTLDDETPIGPERAREILMEICPERNRKEFEETCDSDFSYEMQGARFRCNLFMDRLGMGGVFRIIPSEIPTFEDLNLPQSLLKLCHLSKGLVVVTGPTGSGKSTTLAAMIDYINANLNAHIITIEDPVEFVHPKRKCLINQREVHVHTQGFKNALRAALREDPDIVLVGEMRDLETVAIAIETAETGHLVFGTLHTNTAPSTVDRIIDQFPADRQAQVRTMLAESLKGVIAQTLCRKVGGGRVAALEVLLVNSAVSNLIREGKTFQIPSIMQTGRGLGMVTLTDALVELVKKKEVEPEQAYVKAVHKAEMELAFKRHGIPFTPKGDEKKPPAQAEGAGSGT
jgi:twitching motility protein PilT